MGKNKLERFAEVAEFEHVLELTDFQDEEEEKPRGRWNRDIFDKEQPIVAELACGKGEYTLELASRNPDKNFVGIDIKGARLWKGAKRTLNRDLENIRFLRIYIDHLDEYFAPGEIQEMWITFPDPYPKFSDRSKRLTSPKFLAIYQKVLADGGDIHFKTDSDDLWSYTKSVLDETGCEIHEKVEDIYKERPGDPLLTIKTYFEQKHLANDKTIKYVTFCLPDQPIDTE